MPNGLYVYAIVPHGSNLPTDLRGLAGAPLQAVVCRDLAAVTSSFDPADLRPTDQVMRHEEIVEAVRQNAVSLPVRFGTILPDAPALVRALTERYESLSSDLARLGDKVEMGVTVLWDARFPVEEPALASAGEQSRGGAGTQYLRAKLAEHHREDARRRQAQTIGQELARALGVNALDHRYTILPAPALRATYLVHPSVVARFQSQFESYRRARPDLRVLLSGPWPPYSFVGATNADQNLVGTRPATGNPR